MISNDHRSINHWRVMMDSEIIERGLSVFEKGNSCTGTRGREARWFTGAGASAESYKHLPRYPVAPEDSLSLAAVIDRANKDRQ